MSRLERLSDIYSSHVRLPWSRTLAGAQRVWFVVYDEDDERRLRPRLGQFEFATRQARHPWRHVDVTDAFAEWMAGHPYRDGYFERPDLMTGAALASLRDHVVGHIRAALTAEENTEDTVVALTGVAGLFGFLRVADVVREVEGDICGRLAVFFPGAYRNNQYRLLDRRDGWNYLAVPLASE
jgi:hypothetical protein